MVVTLPIHPLLGRRLRVVSYRSGRVGRRIVEVEHPAGWTLRLPEEWTDRGQPHDLASETAVRSTPRILARVARAVQDILETREFFDRADEGEHGDE